MLAIVWSCNPVQYQEKLIMQIWQNGKNPNFGSQIFFSWVLPLLVSCSKLSSYTIYGKTNEPNLRKWQKTYSWAKFWPKFGLPIFFPWILPLLGVINCCKLSLYAISRKNNDPNSRKWWKTSFWAWFSPGRPKFKPPIFFLI